MEERRNDEVKLLSNCSELRVIMADAILQQHVYKEVMEGAIARTFKAPKIALCHLQRV